MKIRATPEDVREAVKRANVVFDDNVKLQHCIPIGTNGTWLDVKLAVFDADKPGALQNPTTGRRSRFACWHVYGVFMDSLPSYALVISRGKRIKPGDPWEDWLYSGSWLFAGVTGVVMQSDRCRCKNHQ